MNTKREKGFEINLIRDKAISPELKHQVFVKSVIIGAVCGAVFLVLFLRFFTATVKLAQYRKKNKRVQAGIENVINNYKIDEWGQEWIDAYNEIRVINDIYMERNNLAVRLRELVMIVSKKMCIERIDIGKDRKDMVLNIIALAEGEGEFDQIKQFSTSLKKGRLFGSDIKLSSQERTELFGKNVNLIRFNIPLQKEE